MPRLVTYNGKDVFAGQLDPLISKTTSFPSNGDNRMLVEDRIILAGELTGCSLKELLAARDNVNSVFSTNFKTLSIDGIGDFAQAKIESINFDDSPYLASLPYTIMVLHYPEGGYEFGFGITDPKNSYVYTENTNGTLSISQEISAKGINTLNSTPGNALTNAQTFVLAQLDLGDPPLPATIDTLESNFDMYMVEFAEEIDKLNNIITIKRTFETDITETEGGTILRYTSELAEVEGEETLISYNGTVDVGRLGDFDVARNKYEQFRDGLKGLGALITENVTEDEDINQISFSFSIIEGANDPDGIMDDFTITLEENSDSSLFSVSVNGNISSRGQCMSAANFTRIENYYNESAGGIEDHRFDICQDIYDDFYTEDHGSTQENPGVALSPSSISKSIGFNEHDQSASYSASYNDRQIISFKGAPLHSFDFTMTFTPSLYPIRGVPSAYTDGWIFEDLGYRSRAIFSISMNARAFTATPLPQKDFVNLANKEFSKFVKNGEDIFITTNQYVANNQKVVSATYAKSFHTKKKFTDNDNYTTIQTFEL